MHGPRTRTELAHERRRRLASVEGRPSTLDGVLTALAIAVVLAGTAGVTVVAALAVGVVLGAALALSARRSISVPAEPTPG